MELLHWPSENKWDLPSIELESLHLLAYIKFSGANVKTTPTYKSLIQKKGDDLINYCLVYLSVDPPENQTISFLGRSVPCLCLPEDENLTSRKEIVQYLKLKYFDADTWLTDEMRMYSVALTSLIEDKLLPAVHATLWLDATNYTDVIRPVFARNCRYPINFTEARKIHDRLDEFVSVAKVIEGEEVETKMKKLVTEATEAIKQISAYLKERDFLLGHRPSSVDALLFSCLAPLLKIPLSSGTLHNEVRKTPNLLQYVERILSRYFKEEKKPDEKQDDEKSTKNETTSTSTTSTDDDSFRYDWILSVSVATIAMVSYAINAGLLTISSK